MRKRDYDRLTELTRHCFRGGFPDLGKSHPKAGYRFTIGLARYEDGRIDKWRENLGRDKLVAQYRAREMVDIWSAHVDEFLIRARITMPNASIEAVNVPALDRPAARLEAWAEAEAAMQQPSKLAEQINTTLHGEQANGSAAIAPGHKLVAVRIGDGQSNSSTPVLASLAALMLHAATEQWIKNLKERLASEELGDAYEDRCNRFMSHFRNVIADRLVNSIRKPELEEIRRAIQHCPKKNGQRRSRETVRTEIGALKAFFQWLSDNDLWDAPRDWQRFIKADYRNSHFDADADEVADRAKKIDTYSIEEIAKVYAVAGKALRTWILCALNFAWAQNEISTARASHWKMEKHRVARFRGKRTPNAQPVPGRWITWPETWALTTERIAKTPTDETINLKKRAFLTRQNNPLVRYIRKPGKKALREDVVAEAWEDACMRAEVRNRGFAKLRHTAINIVKRIAGKEIADLFCQHAPEDMSEKHYLNAEWKGLFRALRKMRQKLQPIFDEQKPLKPEELRELIAA